jgi:hypothetical protein
LKLSPWQKFALIWEVPFVIVISSPIGSVKILKEQNRAKKHHRPMLNQKKLSKRLEMAETLFYTL